MKINRRIVVYIVYIVIGAALLLGLPELADSLWSGMGLALIVMGAVRMVQYLRCCSDDAYREKQEIEIKDERNKFIRNKAWAWAGYLFVLITAICTIVLTLLGQELLSMAAGCAVFVIVALYWASYLILKKKY